MNIIINIYIFHSFTRQWLHSPLLGLGLFCFIIYFTKLVGPLGRLISPSQGRYLHTRQHKYRVNAHTNIYALSRIRTHDLSVRASEETSCLRPRGHCDRYICIYPEKKLILLQLLSLRFHIPS
jgi:hypothetical protein